MPTLYTHTHIYIRTIKNVKTCHRTHKNGGMYMLMLRNNPTLHVDKILDMFIRNWQPSLIEPVL